MEYALPIDMGWHHIEFSFFSFQCVKQYVSVMISEGSVMLITCPDALCRKDGKLETSEVNNTETYCQIAINVYILYQMLFCPPSQRSWGRGVFELPPVRSNGISVRENNLICCGWNWMISHTGVPYDGIQTFYAGRPNWPIFWPSLHRAVNHR